MLEPAAKAVMLANARGPAGTAQRRLCDVPFRFGKSGRATGYGAFDRGLRAVTCPSNPMLANEVDVFPTEDARADAIAIRCTGSVDPTRTRVEMRHMAIGPVAHIATARDFETAGVQCDVGGADLMLGDVAAREQVHAA